MKLFTKKILQITKKKPKTSKKIKKANNMNSYMSNDSPKKEFFSETPTFSSSNDNLSTEPKILNKNTFYIFFGADSILFKGNEKILEADNKSAKTIYDSKSAMIKTRYSMERWKEFEDGFCKFQNSIKLIEKYLNKKIEIILVLNTNDAIRYYYLFELFKFHPVISRYGSKEILYDPKKKDIKTVIWTCIENLSCNNNFTIVHYDEKLDMFGDNFIQFYEEEFFQNDEGDLCFILIIKLVKKE